MNITDDLHEIARSDLVDWSGGTQHLECWSRDIIAVAQRNIFKPSLIVLIIHKVGDKYRGAVYITKQDFEGGRGEEVQHAQIQ